MGKIMKLVTIVGARPQFVKAATISRALKSFPAIKEIIVHTGQHYDHAMSDIFFEEMEIPHPDYNLEVNGSNHGAMTGRMLEKIEQVLIQESPHMVLVYGDTNSTLAGALAAAKLHIPVAHVEAGLRSFNRRMPEEVNRVLTDQLSHFLFCPTSTAVENLKNENLVQGVHRTGDVMADAFYFYSKRAPSRAKVFQTPPSTKYSLVTIHRAENTDDPDRLRSIFGALDELSKKMKIIVPLHPRTKAKMKSLKISTSAEIIEPVGYFDMIQLLNHCELVLTDSGGLQKEAYLAQKPCITMRDETEWVELIHAGVNSLVGADKNAILEKAKDLITQKLDFVEGLYGNGNSAEDILKVISVFLSNEAK